MRTQLALLSLSLLTLAGCPSESNDDDANVCGDLSRAQDYVEGLEATGDGELVVALMSATPSPPDVGDNTWVLEVTDSAGNPVAGCEGTVTPWMPDHGHGLSTAPTWSEDVEANGS